MPHGSARRKSIPTEFTRNRSGPRNRAQHGRKPAPRQSLGAVQTQREGLAGAESVAAGTVHEASRFFKTLSANSPPLPSRRCGVKVISKTSEASSLRKFKE